MVLRWSSALASTAAWSHAADGLVTLVNIASRGRKGASRSDTARLLIRLITVLQAGVEWRRPDGSCGADPLGKCVLLVDRALNGGRFPDLRRCEVRDLYHVLKAMVRLVFI